MRSTAGWRAQRKLGPYYDPIMAALKLAQLEVKQQNITSHLEKQRFVKMYFVRAINAAARQISATRTTVGQKPIAPGRVKKLFLKQLARDKTEEAEFFRNVFKIVPEKPRQSLRPARL